MHGDLDEDSHVPLFEQIAAILRAAIADGTITARLPSELDIVQRYGVSRPTAHRAVSLLVDAGEARRSRGRGTFVVTEVSKPGSGKPGRRRK